MHTPDRRYRLNGPMDDVAANIRADQQEAPDPNPMLDCDGCGKSFRAKHFVKHGQASANPNEPLLCSRCNAGISPETREQRVKRRMAENENLLRFGEAER